MSRKLLAFLGLAGACAAPEPRQEPPPQATPPAAVPAQVAPERYRDHITALRERLTAAGLGELHVRVEEPFVVVGDGTEQSLARNATTVKWAVEHLEADFFEARPAKILDVYLFESAASYEQGVKALTGDDPTTPYGFYSSHHGGLFMNIATGGGTLVHEIVHPYVEADFPNAPPWLNEGLGSLFEQSAERDGRIVGLTNWRLAGLQRQLGREPSFKELTHYGDNEFYGDDSGVNYAASRYLLYYVQERGKLHELYRALRAARKQDPSGYQTLIATLGIEDARAFQAQWRKYVAKLTFP